MSCLAVASLVVSILAMAHSVEVRQRQCSPAAVGQLVPAQSEAHLCSRSRQSQRRSRLRSFVSVDVAGCSSIAPCHAGCQTPKATHPAEMVADPGALAPQADSALNSCFHFLLHDRARTWRADLMAALAGITRYCTHESPHRARDKSKAVLLRVSGRQIRVKRSLDGTSCHFTVVRLR